MKKRLYSSLAVVLLLLEIVQPLAHAQTASLPADELASDSAQPSASDSATPQQTSPASSAQNALDLNSALQSNGLTQSATTSVASPFADTALQPMPNQTLSQLRPTFDAPMSQSQLAQKINAVIQKLSRHDFKVNEDPTVTVSNTTVSDVQASVYDWKGRKIPVYLEKLSDGSNVIVQVAPPKQFKPGKYTLQVTDASGTTSKQDFTWGVLAVNTDQSIYQPNDTAHLAMAVLDDQGEMVCDAKVSLQIQNAALGIDETLSTDNDKIVVNPACQSHAFSLQPDYEASYLVGAAGTYIMTLTATTQNGTYSISDNFQVQNNVPFIVKRESPTRIYPPDSYPMTLNVTANQDFTGQVFEYVPSSFAVQQASEGAAFKIVKTVGAPMNTGTDSLGSFVNLRLPFDGNHKVTQGFGVMLTDPQEKSLYDKFGLAGHDGVDFGLPEGTPVVAVDDGTVALAGDGAYGTTIVIQHSWGKSYYGHLSQLDVTLGQTVHKGDQIALSGHTGLVTGPHLHFSIKPNHNNPDNGYYGKIDPTPYLGLTQDTTTVLATNTMIPDTVTMLAWDVDLKKGESTTLAYTFKAPNISPQFYTLGPAQFVAQNKKPVFQEARIWQIAADAIFPATSYLSNTTSGQTSTSWQIVTSAPASSDVTIGNKIAKSTGYFQWQPGVTSNATSHASAPTTIDGKGFIYDTGLDSTIPAGTWTFNVRTKNSSTTATGVANVTVCVWKVTISGGTPSVVSSIIPCTDGATDIINGSTALSASSITVNSVAAQSFTSTQFLYVEYWQHVTTQSGVNNFVTNFEANAGVSDDIVTPGSSSNTAPSAPTRDSPSLGATGLSTTPTFLMTSTDPESDNLQYTLFIYSNSTCTTTVQTDIESSSQAGWSGHTATCTTTNDCYPSGTQASYTVQSALSSGTTYWWSAAAIDPQGSNLTVSDTCNANASFTTAAAVTGPTLDQLMRHGKWFNSSGVRQPFAF